MKFFKNVIPGAMLAIGIVAATPEAKAQLGSPAQWSVTAGRSSLALTNGELATNIFNFPKNKDVGVHINFALHAAGTSNVVFTIDKSIKSGKWMTGDTTITLAGTGTTEVNFVTNMTINAAQALRVRVSNACPNTMAVTNLTISVADK